MVTINHLKIDSLYPFLLASFSQFSPAEWFLKPIFYEVPQRDPNPIFIGRDWLYRDIADHLISHLPTNCGVIIIGSPGSGKTAIILKLVGNSCFGSRQSGLKGESIF
jgi:Cdc6-like AAA superfamily ATPase